MASGKARFPAFDSTPVNVKIATQTLLWRIVVPGCLSIVGVALILFPLLWERVFVDHINIILVELFRELGNAFIISAILSITVDIILKQRLISEVKEDVFQAAMGYLFPE